MPLDQAIYMSGIDKIIGVRGRWLYKFNSSTGELEDSSQWCTSANGVATIAAIGSDLYVAGLATSIRRVGPTPYESDATEVVKFNASTMAIDSVISDIADNIGFNYSSASIPGFRNMIAVGSYLFFWSANGLWVVDPTNVVATIAQPGGTFSNISFSDTIYNSGLALMGFCEQKNHSITWYDASDLSTASYSTEGYNDPNPSDSSAFAMVGTTISEANSCGYSVEGRGNIIKHDLSAFLTTLVPTRRISILDTDATPVRIKCSPIDGKIYVPCGRTNTVYAFDPVAYASDETPGTPFSGFDDPIDVVFTATKAFAVQNGRIGLKEIV